LISENQHSSSLSRIGTGSIIASGVVDKDIPSGLVLLKQQPSNASRCCSVVAMSRRLAFFFVCSVLLQATAIAEYYVIGVSGGLQDGFPDRGKMDYVDSKAIFLGRALVRGYKAYLDVMQEGWRQYVVRST
jgi:hypothetical protein